ncbi:hypothetical protein V8E36_006576 [Tilletia maclaganii]
MSQVDVQRQHALPMSVSSASPATTSATVHSPASISPMDSPASSSTTSSVASIDSADAKALSGPSKPLPIGAPNADPGAPLVSILRNPKSGTNATGAGELTMPVAAIPEVEGGSPSGRALSGVSPTATFSAIKSAFSSVGKRANSIGRKESKEAGLKQPLGQSFKREGPPPVDAKGKIQGAPLLEHDPRSTGSDAEEAGELSASSEHSHTASSSDHHPSIGRRSPSDAGTSSSNLSADGERGRPQIDGPSDTSSPRKASRFLRSPSTASSSHASESSHGSGSCASHAIRFCPLPATGRLKRANSITIGIAARSQMLLSQGSGPVPRSGGGRAPVVQANAHVHSHSSVHVTDPRHSGLQQQGRPVAAAAWYEPGGELPPDVIDVGAELKKVGKFAWRKMRGEGKNRGGGGGGGEAGGQQQQQSGQTEKSPSRGSGTTTLPANVEVDEGETDGMKTPRAAPPKGLVPQQQSPLASTMSQDNKPSSSSTSAAETASTQTSGSPPSPPPANAVPFHRRVSTGTFLGLESLREMQSKRHSELVGDDKDDGNDDSNDDVFVDSLSRGVSLEEERAKADGPGAASSPSDAKAARKDTWTEEEKALAEAKIQQQKDEEAREEAQEAASS